MKITTDNRPRVLVCWHDIPYNVRHEFDYILEENWYSDRFVKYKGVWYDTQDAQGITTSPLMGMMGWDMRVEPTDPLAKWHAIVSDSYFSGIVFRFCDENGVIVGRYCT